MIYSILNKKLLPSNVKDVSYIAENPNDIFKAHSNDVHYVCHSRICFQIQRQALSELLTCTNCAFVFTAPVLAELGVSL